MTPQQIKRNNIILLVCLLLAISVFPLFQVNRIVLKNVLLATIVLSSTFCLDFRPWTRRILNPVGFAVITLLLLSVYINNDLLHTIDYIATFLFLLLVVVFIVRHIARKKEVDAAIIVSSINGYLLLGVLWALLLHSAYVLESTIPGNAPSMDFPGGGHPTYYEFVYFSFITMTTLGYGDITPVSPAARSLSLLVAISGQFYMTLLVALLVGKYLATKKDV